MANNASEVLIGANGQIYVADTDATAPADATTPLDTGWAELGFVSEDGATFTVGKDIADVNAWQSFWPLRKIATAKTCMLAFGLEQWSRDTIEFALEGTVNDNSGEWVFTPNSPEVIQEKSMVLDWQDGDRDYRLYIVRGLVSENVETKLVRTEAALLPVTFAALDPGEADVFTIFTNDPGFGAGS